MDQKNNGEGIKSILKDFGRGIKQHWGVMIYMIICVIALIVLQDYIRFEPGESKVTNKFSKADFSSDKSWLGCRQHQHDCTYKALVKDRSAISILDECGPEDICDQLFGGKSK